MIDILTETQEFKTRKTIRSFAASQAPPAPQSCWAEFGVREGESARLLLGHLPVGGSLHLFDSWEGLPETWHRRSGGSGVKKGSFSCPQPDMKDSRCVYWPGWFTETASAFAETKKTIQLVHLDCDLYSSTITVLETVGHLFSPGCVIIFDDLFGYPLWREHQWRAWEEWIGTRDHKWIAHTPKGQAAVRLP